MTTADNQPPFDVVMALTYYTPYVSGLTDAARAVAEHLARHGQRVCVVTTRHDPRLPRTETIRGVHVVRTGVVARIGKGVISPSFVPTIRRLSNGASVLNIHLPMLEAGAIALACRGPELVTTYQCDVAVSGPGRLERLQRAVIDYSSGVALRRSAAIGVSSDDYARSSRVWSAMAGRTREIAPPTVERTPGDPIYRETPGMHVGFLGRIVEEKGLEYLVDGFLAAAEPDDRLLIGGDYTRIAGGSVVEKVRRSIGDDPRVRLLGFIPDETVDSFYASLDVFALPSVNSFEAFGIVQVEAMLMGIPSLTSDLPGVRTPVERTGFGVVVRRADAAAIADGLRALRANPPNPALCDRVRELYGGGASVEAYRRLFDDLR